MVLFLDLFWGSLSESKKSHGKSYGWYVWDLYAYIYIIILNCNETNDHRIFWDHTGPAPFFDLPLVYCINFQKLRQTLICRQCRTLGPLCFLSCFFGGRCAIIKVNRCQQSTRFSIRRHGTLLQGKLAPIPQRDGDSSSDYSEVPDP